MTHPNGLQIDALKRAGYNYFWTSRQSVREMAAFAARKALEKANIQEKDIGFIVAGFSGIPDFIGIDFACQVGSELHCQWIRTVNLIEGCGSAVTVWRQAALLAAELAVGKKGLVVLAQRISDKHQDRFGLMNAVLSDGAVVAVVGNSVRGKGQGGFRYIAVEDISDCRYVDMMRIEYGGGFLPLLPKERDSRYDKLGRERMMENYRFSSADLIAFLNLRIENSVNIIRNIIAKSNKRHGIPFLLHTLEGIQSIEKLCLRTDIPIEKSNLSLLAELGHVGCVDPLLSLQILTERGVIQLGDEVVMSTISTGLKWGAALFRYEGEL
ncbi:3-oxoacyl-[acyl-carrier-protein] synthase III C-terminal domain-containing protein [Bartonella queenslandensis]|uniref:3-oxoacyl-[acyl-carrier-protein] synthase III C-terminal domain-containing protein n=1 Tax=Bartonella queenslandensis TaxID=481138 RepID=UPI001BA9351C